VKENLQTLLTARLGAADVEKRTKANSQNVGVAGRHDLIEKTIELLLCRITTG